MNRLCLFAAAGMVVLGTAPASRAQDTVRLVGGCPEIAGVNCPARQAPPVDYPKNALPGQCFAQVRTAPTFQTYTEQVVVSPSRVERREVPPVYDWGERQVLVQPERVEHHLVPATYRTVTETVVVSPATTRVEHSEPVYDTVTEKVLVKAAHTEWRRTFVGPGGVIPEGARVEPTGEVVCLVEVPAEYSNVERRVLREPGRTVEIPVPAVTQQVTRQVIDHPEHVVETRIPAVYRTEKFRRLVSGARTETVTIPPVFATHQQQREVSPGELKWVLADCDTKRPLFPEPPGPPPNGPPPSGPPPSAPPPGYSAY